MALNHKLKSNTEREIIQGSSGNDVVFEGSQGEAIDISASDYIDLEGFTVFVGGEGNLIVDLKNGGSNLSFVDVQGYQPLIVTKVYTTSTATDLIALI